MAYDKPNHTQIPNLFLDRDLSKITSLAELKVTLIVMRSTIGWHEKRVEMGITEIIGLTGMSRQSVIEGIRLAIKRGTVKRQRSGHTFLYEAQIVTVKKVDSSEDERVKILDQKVDSSEVSPNNVLKKEKKAVSGIKKPRREEPVIDPPFQGERFLVALADYEAHRREMGKSKILHTTGRKRLYEKLELFGEHDATLALNEAVANGWIGVFQPKNNNNSRNGHGNGIYDPSTQLSAVEKERKQAELRQRMTGRAA